MQNILNRIILIIVIFREALYNQWNNFV